MSKNQLYPIFLKLDVLNVLIVGGGNVGLEKLSFLLKSSPNANVTVVAEFFLEETLSLGKDNKVSFIQKSYESTDLEGYQLVIAATDKEEVNQLIYDDARASRILVNVADNPPLCDFYLGGIVTKGDLKIAISTNGNSPTLAKRLRQLFEEVFPDDIQQLLDNLNTYRSRLKGDFQVKLEALNELTRSLIK